MIVRLLLPLALSAALGSAPAAEPLRVFIRAGQSNRGQEVHAHPRFLGEWTKLLTERGLKVEGGMALPTAEQLARTDVLVMYAQDGGGFPSGPARDGLNAFLKRGGGLVVLHTAVVPTPNIPDGAAHWKSVIGGSWVAGTTKWLEGPMNFYYVDRTHPLTRDAANFDLDDEIYYDMDMDPRVRVLGAAYTPNIRSTRNDQRGLPQKGKITVYDIQPQMWTFENQLDGGQPYRAFVSIPGHKFGTFNLPHYRAVLLRGIAWAGKRANLDEFARPEELATLRYPEGGPSRPDKSLAQTVTHPDFKVSLVASEPLFNKAMNIDWDPQGRLWVAETPEYPDGRFANDKTDLVQRWTDAPVGADGRYDRPAYDKISILTDTNGDGVMDKKDIFYEGLELVTSFVFHRDGVIAAAAPDIWFLRDTNGDGKADTQTKLYTGLGTRDTHAVINNLRWGFDGWIYATHGYSSGTVTSGDGSRNYGNIGSGVVRFKPDGSAFEQYSSKGGNTWGLQIAWDNEVFWTQPTSTDLLMNVVLPEHLMARARVPGTSSYKVVRKSPKSYSLIPYDQLPYVQIDLVGTFTAAAGCVIYDGGSWPAQWHYSYFTTEPTINLVHHEIVKPDGPSFTMTKDPAREETEFMASRDYWWRPIEVRTGPDGALYVVDFYNQAVAHNDTRGPKHGPRNAAIRPDRDHYYGRIWRVDHKDAKKLDVPKLDRRDEAGLVKALEHPNDHVRMNALRLLVERGTTLPNAALAALKEVAEGQQKTPQSRVAAMWTLARLGKLNDSTVAAAARSPLDAVRKNAMMIAAAMPVGPIVPRQSALTLLNDPNPRVRLEALIALATQPLDEAAAKALVEAYPRLDDNWSKSAFLIAAARSPATVLDAALTAANVNHELVGQLTGLLVSSQNADEAAKLVIALAAKPAAQDAAKRAALESLAAGLRADAVPAWSAHLQQALQTLVTSPNASLATAALPLVSRWDKGGVLAGEVKKQTQAQIAKLTDAAQPDDLRAQVVTSLLAMRQSDAAIVPAVAGLLGSSSSGALQTRVLESLGNLPDDAIGREIVKAFPKLSGELHDAALNQLLKRGPWALALIEALAAGSVDPQHLGPADVHRLRLHPSAEVSRRANALMDKLRGPAAKEKAELIAKLAHEVEKPGNAAKGKELYVANCANCHQFNDVGVLVGPPLTGMGAHGPAELLGHIIDPNKEVDFSFVAISIETKDGEVHDGIVTRENNALVALRNAQGEKEIAKANIATRRNTGRSLMPEGFEALGAEGLRDLLAYLCGSDTRFRFIDLSPAFTASTREGLYMTKEPSGGQLPLAKTGVVQAHGVPFNVIDPAKLPRNVMVLKGGDGRSYSRRELPQKVEAKVGFAAKQLHFLGNVGGWAFPFGQEKEASLKVAVHYADGKTEELVFKNGEDIADYIREVDVPNSKLARGIAADGKQVRFSSRKLTGSGVIEKLTFESADGSVAPTTLAVTADLSADPLPAMPQTAAPAEGKGKAKGKGKNTPVQVAAATGGAGTTPAAPFQWGTGLKVLLVGGGSAHDYQRFFNLADTELLKAAGYSVNYTENGAVTARELANVDVAVLSVNRAEWATPELRQALFEFVNKGKGLVLLHPGLWYNFRDWPEYNRELAGGGSRGHDKYGEFEVKLEGKEHPLVAGVPASFKINDELYYYQADAAGTPIEVLATATSTQRPGTYPQVFVVKHPKTRIAGITLGHDAFAHSHPAYQTLLKNAVKWVAGK